MFRNTVAQALDYLTPAYRTRLVWSLPLILCIQDSEFLSGPQTHTSFPQPSVGASPSPSGPNCVLSWGDLPILLSVPLPNMCHTVLRAVSKLLSHWTVGRVSVFFHCLMHSRYSTEHLLEE